DLFAPHDRPAPATTHAVTANDALEAAVKEAADNVAVRKRDDGKIDIALTGPGGDAVAAALTSAVAETERPARREAIRNHRLTLPPADRGERFVVPRLFASVQGELTFADTDVLLEFHEWSLRDKDLTLSEGEFAIRETARGFEIDLDGNRIAYRAA